MAYLNDYIIAQNINIKKSINNMKARECKKNCEFPRIQDFYLKNEINIKIIERSDNQKI